MISKFLNFRGKDRFVIQNKMRRTNQTGN
jgi:hypothetical protein